MVQQYVGKDPEDDDHWDKRPNTTITTLWKQTKDDLQLRRATISTNLAVQAQGQKSAKTLDDILPDYLKDLKDVFEKKAAERMPISRPWDHAIDLKPGFVPRD